MITKEQLRMARAALNMSREALAEKADVAQGTIHRYENGKVSLSDTLEKLKEALEGEGVVFTPESDTLEAGVTLRKDRPAQPDK